VRGRCPHLPDNPSPPDPLPQAFSPSPRPPLPQGEGLDSVRGRCPHLPDKRASFAPVPHGWQPVEKTKCRHRESRCSRDVAISGCGSCPCAADALVCPKIRFFAPGAPPLAVGVSCLPINRFLPFSCSPNWLCFVIFRGTLFGQIGGKVIPFLTETTHPQPWKGLGYPNIHVGEIGAA
jgi:hypothetical protein